MSSLKADAAAFEEIRDCGNGFPVVAAVIAHGENEIAKRVVAVRDFEGLFHGQRGLVFCFLEMAYATRARTVRPLMVGFVHIPAEGADGENKVPEGQAGLRGGFGGFFHGLVFWGVFCWSRFSISNARAKQDRMLQGMTCHAAVLFNPEIKCFACFGDGGVQELLAVEFWTDIPRADPISPISSRQTSMDNTLPHQAPKFINRLIKWSLSAPAEHSCPLPGIGSGCDSPSLPKAATPYSYRHECPFIAERLPIFVRIFGRPLRRCS